MAATITPGPWVITPDARLPFDLRIHTTQGVAIAKVYGRDATENETDTKAIAAVPSLIEALEEVREHCSERADAECDAGSADWTGNAEMRLLMTVEAALRKAGVL